LDGGVCQGFGAQLCGKDVDEATPGLAERLTTDPGAYLQLIAVADLQVQESEKLLHEYVLLARHAGLSWDQIAESLGITRVEAQKKFIAAMANQSGSLELTSAAEVVAAVEAAKLPPVGTRVTVRGDDDILQHAGPYGWHGVAATTNTWTLEFDNQQWEHVCKYSKKAPEGDGWQLAAKWLATRYWKRPTELPILPGAPDPYSFGN